MRIPLFVTNRRSRTGHFYDISPIRWFLVVNFCRVCEVRYVFTCVTIRIISSVFPDFPPTTVRAAHPIRDKHCSADFWIFWIFLNFKFPPPLRYFACTSYESLRLYPVKFSFDVTVISLVIYLVRVLIILRPCSYSVGNTTAVPTDYRIEYAIQLPTVLLLYMLVNFGFPDCI